MSLQNTFEGQPVLGWSIDSFDRLDEIIKEEKTRIEKLEKLVAAAFGQRRKMIKSSLKNFPFICDTSEALKKCDIAENLRAENLTIQQFCQLAKFVENKTSNSNVIED